MVVEDADGRAQRAQQGRGVVRQAVVRQVLAGGAHGEGRQRRLRAVAARGKAVGTAVFTEQVASRSVLAKRGQRRTLARPGRWAGLAGPSQIYRIQAGSSNQAEPEQVTKPAARGAALAHTMYDDGQG